MEEQHGFAAQHEAALDRLEALGVLYPCACSRSLLRAESDPALGRGARYPNRCRGRSLPAGGWRASGEPLRAVLPAGRIAPSDEGGLDLAQDPVAEVGDFVVRRRDGALAYQLAVVVDDAASVVPTCCAGTTSRRARRRRSRSRRLLGLPEPVYRHHLLLLDEDGGKLAKRHGALGADALRGVYSAPELVGFLAFACGIRPGPAPATPAELLRDFDWARVSREDRVVRWDGAALALGR